MKFEGIYTPAITPHREDGSIDRDAFVAQLEYLIAAGVHGIINGGSTGEYYAQSMQERLEMASLTREVTRGGDDIQLTATQFELLRYLMENPKRVVSKSQILERVWQYDFGGQANIVELYISYLRKKIDVDRAPMIHTVRGAGYVIKPADA